MEIWLILSTFLAILVYCAYKASRNRGTARREKRINTFAFPPSIKQKVMERYPHLTETQAALVMKGLREYFHCCNVAGNRMVAMPSQAVDVAWHELILFTRLYEQFCRKHLGRFLHHVPAEAMQSTMIAQTGIKTAWKAACQREAINTEFPQRLPLLFALDKQLDIPDGFHYSLDCQSNKNTNNNVFCATHIGCHSSCSSGSGGSHGCGSSCGGGGGCGGS